MNRTGVALLFTLVGSAPLRSALADDQLVVYDDSQFAASSYDQADLCPEVTDVVGHRNCPRYGMWGAALEVPYMFVHFGLNMRHLPRASAGSSPGVARSIAEPATPAAGSDLSYGFVERINISLSRAIYVGIEAEVGVSDVRASEAGARHLGVGGLGLAGLHGGLGFAVLGVELAWGGRIVETELSSARLSGEAVLEARARADLWLGPWVTLGAAIGTSLIDEGDWMTGLYFGFHTYSYGGHR